jgi:hypothetical protein
VGVPSKDRKVSGGDRGWDERNYMRKPLCVVTICAGYIHCTDLLVSEWGGGIFKLYMNKLQPLFFYGSVIVWSE